MDWNSVNRVVFEANLLPKLIKQLGLVIHVVFFPDDVAFPATNFRLNNDLADDKECYTTSFGMLCDSDVV